jgi:hypothetical protein
MAFNISSLLDTMISAVKPTLEGFGKIAGEIARSTRKALRLLADQIVFAGKSLIDHSMTELEAREIVSSAMLLVVANVARAEVLVKAQAQKVIDAAIGAIKGTVNAAVGLALL